MPMRRSSEVEDKYDAAIAWLREKDRMKGSYYEEVACLMEELSVVSTASLQTAEADRRQVNPPLIVIPGVGG